MADDYEVLLKGRRYVLGETADSYGIWQRAASGEPLERFPLTAEGFDAAEARLHELSRAGRWDSERIRAVLLGVVWGGAALWVVAGIGAALVAGLVFGGIAEGIDFLTELAYVLDSVGYRLAIGALVVLVALSIVSRRSEPASPAGESASTPGRWDRALTLTAAIALAVWIVSAFATRTLQPTAPPGFFGDQGPNTAYVVATVVEAVAFRTGIAAAAVLIASRLGLWARRPAG